MQQLTFGEGGVYQWKINGQYANGDAYVMQYGTTNGSTDVSVSQTCDGCGQYPLTFPFFRCTECHDIDLCQDCVHHSATDLPRTNPVSSNLWFPMQSTMQSTTQSSDSTATPFAHQANHLLHRVANWNQYVSVINSPSIHACNL
jgi:hypothetical protein